jgi:hypothetical protein
VVSTSSHFFGQDVLRDLLLASCLRTCLAFRERFGASLGTAHESEDTWVKRARSFVAGLEENDVSASLLHFFLEGSASLQYQNADIHVSSPRVDIEVKFAGTRNKANWPLGTGKTPGKTGFNKDWQNLLNGRADAWVVFWPSAAMLSGGSGVKGAVSECLSISAGQEKGEARTFTRYQVAPFLHFFDVRTRQNKKSQWFVFRNPNEAIQLLDIRWEFVAGTWRERKQRAYVIVQHVGECWPSSAVPVGARWPVWASICTVAAEDVISGLRARLGLVPLVMDSRSASAELLP